MAFTAAANGATAQDGRLAIHLLGSVESFHGEGLAIVGNGGDTLDALSADEIHVQHAGTADAQNVDLAAIHAVLGAELI